MTQGGTFVNILTFYQIRHSVFDHKNTLFFEIAISISQILPSVKILCSECIPVLICGKINKNQKNLVLLKNQHTFFSILWYYINKGD